MFPCLTPEIVFLTVNVVQTKAALNICLVPDRNWGPLHSFFFEKVEKWIHLVSSTLTKVLFKNRLQDLCQEGCSSCQCQCPHTFRWCLQTKLETSEVLLWLNYFAYCLLWVFPSAFLSSIHIQQVTECVCERACLCVCVCTGESHWCVWCGLCV